MKKILFSFLFIILLALSVNAQNKAIGESCLNNNECTSGICEGSLCQSVSILDRPSATFWIIFITGLLVLIILVLGFWYWKFKKTGEIVGATIKEFTQKPPMR